MLPRSPIQHTKGADDTMFGLSDKYGTPEYQAHYSGEPNCWQCCHENNEHMATILKEKKGTTQHVQGTIRNEKKHTADNTHKARHDTQLRNLDNTSHAQEPLM